MPCVPKCKPQDYENLRLLYKQSLQQFYEDLQLLYKQSPQLFS